MAKQIKTADANKKRAGISKEKKKTKSDDRFVYEDERLPEYVKTEDDLPEDDPYDTPPYERPLDGERP